MFKIDEATQRTKEIQDCFNQRYPGMNLTITFGYAPLSEEGDNNPIISGNPSVPTKAEYNKLMQESDQAIMGARGHGIFKAGAEAEHQYFFSYIKQACLDNGWNYGALMHYMSQCAEEVKPIPVESSFQLKSDENIEGEMHTWLMDQIERVKNDVDVDRSAGLEFR